MNVDAYLAGCHPKPEGIVPAIAFLLGQKPFPMNDLAYCNDCSIKDNKIHNRLKVARYP